MFCLKIEFRQRNSALKFNGFRHPNLVNVFSLGKIIYSAARWPDGPAGYMAVEFDRHAATLFPRRLSASFRSVRSMWRFNMINTVTIYRLSDRQTGLASREGEKRNRLYKYPPPREFNMQRFGKLAPNPPFGMPFYFKPYRL